MRLVRAAIVPILVVALASTAFAKVPLIDGWLDPDYGAALVTQTTQTSSDNTLGALDASNGCELDGAYGVVLGEVLYLFLPGNMWLEPNPIDPGTRSTDLHLFFDTTPGGQGTLRSTSCDFCPLQGIAGLTFDTEFTPDYWIGLRGVGGPDFSVPYALVGWRAALPSSDPDTTTFLGRTATVNSRFFAQGENPHDIRASLDNSNVAGVNQGCGSGSGAGVSSGIELSIPLAAIGGSTGSIRVSAFLSYLGVSVENQVLAPAPGACSLGPGSALDFRQIAGPQFFDVLPRQNPSAVPITTDLALHIAPNRGQGLSVRLWLPSSAPARIDVVDAAGRRWLSREVTGASASQTFVLAPPGELPGGVYFLRLAQNGREAFARAVVIP